MIINSIINPLTAIYDTVNGDVVDNPKIKHHSQILIEELAPIIKVHLARESCESILEKVERVAKQTYNNSSSMRQDIIMKRITEIDFISGYLINMAKKMGKQLPEHQKIVKQVKVLEKEH